MSSTQHMENNFILNTINISKNRYSNIEINHLKEDKDKRKRKNQQTFCFVSFGSLTNPPHLCLQLFLALH